MNDDDTKPRNDLHALQEHLFTALREVRSGAMDLDKARMVNELGKTLIDSGRVQVEHIRVTGEGGSKFVEGDDAAEALPPGITGRIVHRMK